LGRLGPNIYYNIIYLKKQKISKKISKIISIFFIFSNVFLPIVHNIGLYIYTVKYKSGIKILDLLQNISKKFKTFFKKISKTFKLISHFKNKKGVK